MIRFARNLLSRDRTRHLLALKAMADRMFGDYRLTWWQIDWWTDPEFNAFLDRFEERQGFNTQRRWMLHELLKLARDVPGDTAECGVYKGAGSWLICQLGRTHHLFDSFEGLSDPSATDGEHWGKGDMAVGEKEVARALDGLNVVFHKGWIPDRFPDVAERRFAFVHVDVDLYEPTRDSFEFFYPRLSPGGVLVCDDYACGTCPGATKAVDEFMVDKPEPMIALPAGGGFFIKR